MVALYIYGLHAVKKKLQHSSEDCIELYCLKNNNKRQLEIINLAKQKGISVVHQSRDKLTELSPSESHQGCLLLAQEYENKAVSVKELIQDIDKDSLFLVLDGVQDPHNLGACLRTADAAGVAAVIVPKDRSVGMTPAVKKVAAGAAETVPLITVTNLSRSLKELKAAGMWLVGTSGDAEKTLYEQRLSGPIALVMGAEGEGIRRLTAEQCDFLVRLPMKGQVESLNVSVATGVCLYEINRSRMD